MSQLQSWLLAQAYIVQPCTSVKDHSYTQIDVREMRKTEVKIILCFLVKNSKIPVFLPYRTFYYLALPLSTTMLSLSTTTLLGVDITPQSLYGSK